MIATTDTGEWPKLCPLWQMSSVNIASELCTTIPSVSGIPPSSKATATMITEKRPGHLNLAAGLKIAPHPILGRRL